MQSLITAAARALAAGDPLGALKRIALRDDPPALALRGVAMAQLGDYTKARKLLCRAARGFGARERLAQARCQVADAEVALAARDLTRSSRSLAAVAQTLDAFGDHANAFHARLIDARRPRWWRVWNSPVPSSRCAVFARRTLRPHCIAHTLPLLTQASRR
jgi:hypothetical protein